MTTQLAPTSLANADLDVAFGEGTLNRISARIRETSGLIAELQETQEWNMTEFLSAQRMLVDALERRNSLRK